MELRAIPQGRTPAKRYKDRNCHQEELLRDLTFPNTPLGGADALQPGRHIDLEISAVLC